MSLLAPNGRPSNLNPEEWCLVRTPEFKRIYGDWERLSLAKRYDSGIDEISLARLKQGITVDLDSNGEPILAPAIRSEISKIKSSIYGRKGLFFVSNNERAAYLSVIILLGCLLTYQYLKR